MAPTASRNTYRSAKHEDVHDATIGIVGLIPLIESSAHEHACSSLGGRGCSCEFSRETYHVFSAYAGYVLLPTRRERNVIHLALGHLTANTAVNAQERAKEIEDRCDKGFSFSCLDTLHGHCALEHVDVGLGMKP